MKTTYDENTGILKVERNFPVGKKLTAGFILNLDLIDIEVTPLKREPGWYLARLHKGDRYEVIYICSRGYCNKAGYSPDYLQSDFCYISPTPLNLEELAKGGGV